MLTEPGPCACGLGNSRPPGPAAPLAPVLPALPHRPTLEALLKLARGAVRAQRHVFAVSTGATGATNVIKWGHLGATAPRGEKGRIRFLEQSYLDGE